METAQTEGLALPPLWAREASMPEKHATVELEWKEPWMEQKRRRVHTTSLECPQCHNNGDGKQRQRLR
jgi:cytochrome c-type biogenesis protein CcmH/NrfF